MAKPVRKPRKVSEHYTSGLQPPSDVFPVPPDGKTRTSGVPGKFGPAKSRILRLFREDGELITIRNIQQRLGISYQAAYEHVKGRNGLLALGLLHQIPGENPGLFGLSSSGKMNSTPPLFRGSHERLNAWV